MINGTNNNNGEEVKIEKILVKRVGWVVAIVSITISIVMFIVIPQLQIKNDINLIMKDIEIINTNDLVHINRYIEELKELGNERNDKLDEVCRKVDRLLIILEKESL